MIRMQHDMKSNNNSEMFSITVINNNNKKSQWKRDGTTIECKIKHIVQRQTRVGNSLQATSSPAVPHYKSYVLQVQQHSKLHLHPTRWHLRKESFQCQTLTPTLPPAARLVLFAHFAVSVFGVLVTNFEYLPIIQSHLNPAEHRLQPCSSSEAKLVNTSNMHISSFSKTHSRLDKLVCSGHKLVCS